MRTTLLRFLRNLRRGEQLKPNRKLITLVVCITISAVFWLLQAYSKIYSSIISYPVRYVNMPDNRVLTEPVPDRVSLMIRAQGFLLLFQKIRSNKDTIDFDVSGISLYPRGAIHTGLLSTQHRLDDITRQFDPEISVLKIIPDTIRFSFARKVQKRVPVRVLHHLTFDKQYQLNRNIIFEPSEVLVTGPGFLLDTLTFIYSDSLIMENLHEETSVLLPLRVPDEHPAIKIDRSEVNVTIPVEKFTETSVKINVDKVNVPAGYDARLIPEKVEITYLVPFSRFDDVTSRSFTARVDFSKYDQLKRLPVEIVEQPDYIKVVRTEPSRVEYILRRR